MNQIVMSYVSIKRMYYKVIVIVIIIIILSILLNLQFVY